MNRFTGIGSLVAEKILVTGGAGYIGSHVCKILHQYGYTPIVFDNLSGGYQWAVKWGPLVIGDILHARDLDQVFTTHQPKAVIHLASLINVRESMMNPSKYYQTNVLGTFSLLQAMIRHDVKKFVFSSSAAVYGYPLSPLIDEEHSKLPTNCYGKTKWMVEQILQDFHQAYGLSSLSLRYFNAAGADFDAEIGEAHQPETHLIPRIIFTALKRQEHLSIYGNQHPTVDGTAIRDYIHVVDLADAHVKALQWIEKHQACQALNLGTGQGFSVQETIEAVKLTTNLKVATKLEPLNPGEPPRLVANSSKAYQLINWRPKYSSLEKIIESACKWHSKYEG